MDIFLVRHTTPAVPKGTCYGHTDLGLVDAYSLEIELVKTKITIQSDLIYSSPLTRCTLLANDLGRSVSTDDRLMEVNFGDWEMKAWNDISADQLNPWMSDFVMTPPPNGESFHELILRVEEFFQELLKSEAKTITVVAHAGVIRAALGFFLGMPAENLFRLNIDYGSVSLIKTEKAHHQLVYMNR